jgi:HSP20 family protein
MSGNRKKEEITLREKEESSKEEGEQTRPGVYYSPSVDIYENEEGLTLLADLPGVTEENLDIDLEDRKLTINGTVPPPEKRFHSVYSEYGIGGYTRSFRLGEAIDRTKINASLKDGVLTLTLPKADKLKPRKIQVTT